MSYFFLFLSPPTDEADSEEIGSLVHSIHTSLDNAYYTRDIVLETCDIPAWEIWEFIPFAPDAVDEPLHGTWKFISACRREEGPTTSPGYDHAAGYPD